jgi:hypothetical protein
MSGTIPSRATVPEPTESAQPNAREPYYSDRMLTVFAGDCREVMAAMEPRPSEVELASEEAARLRYLRKTARAEALRKMREEHPLKFSQKHKRKHR